MVGSIALSNSDDVVSKGLLNGQCDVLQMNIVSHRLLFNLN